MAVEKNSMLPPLDDAVAHSHRFILVICLAALLPGLGCYFCVAYSFFFQLDMVLNFTQSEHCPDVRSAFPPVSYSIGVWKPQKYIWLLVLFVHFPHRMIFIVLYRRLFYTFSHESKIYGLALQAYTATLWLEASGLILVSVVDIKSHFIIHAIAFAMWIIFFNFNMLFNVVLGYFSGFHKSHTRLNKIWWIKLAMLISGIAVSLTTPVSYPLFIKYCWVEAYTLFSIAEVIMVGYNAVFYALSYFEFPATRVTVGIRSKTSLATSRAYSTTSTVRSSASSTSTDKSTITISTSTNPLTIEEEDDSKVIFT